MQNMALRVEKDARSSASSVHHVRIRGLDGIRALAFFVVLGGHCGFSWIPNGFGVTVFFFLSGYLITTLLRQEWIESGSISISRFYIRRAFRILPPFYIALLLGIVAALAGWTESGVNWKAVGLAQLFLTNYTPFWIHANVPSGLTVLWSLGVEEHFYLVFPCLYALFLARNVSRKKQILVLSSICVVVLAWRIILKAGFDTNWYRIYTGTDTRLDSILYGAIMAVGINPIIDKRERVSQRVLAFAAIVGTIVLVASIAARGEIFRETVRYTLQGLALFPIFILIVQYQNSAITRFLELGFLKHIGELSYSLYLVHAIVLGIVTRWLKVGPSVTLLLTLSSSYLIAFAMRHYIELPSSRLRQCVLRRLKDIRPKVGNRVACQI